MIPRIRPYFDHTYIDAVRDFQPGIKREEHLEVISKKLKSYYPNTEKFEFFNFGRSSLCISFDLLDCRAGDEIIMPCFTCPSVLQTIIYKKLKPVLVDINFDFTMNVNQIKDSITSKTKAILETHVFGIPSNVLEIEEIASQKDVPVIEDCAQTFCSEVNGLKLGSIGDLAFTSLQNDKPISMGGGSILLVNNKELAHKLDSEISGLPLNPIIEEKCAFLSLLSFYLKTDGSIYDKFIGVHDYYHYFKQNSSERSYILNNLLNDKSLEQIKRIKISKSKNFRNLYGFLPSLFAKNKQTQPLPLLMNCFSLSLLNTVIDYIKQSNKIRIANGKIYTDNLKSNNNIFPPNQDDNIPYLRYPIICKDEIFNNLIRKNLNIKGYEVGNFNWPTSINRLLRSKEISKRNFECDLFNSNKLDLPSHPYIKEKDVLNICNIINKFEEN